MKTVKFSQDLAQLILDGKKTTTWRLFDDKDLRTGDAIELINKATGEVFGQAVISSVVEKPIKKLDDADWEGHERFPSEEAMYAKYRGYYPGQEVGPDTIVKILHFIMIKDSENNILQYQLARVGTSVTCPAAVIIRDDAILLGLRNYTPDKWKTISVWTTPGGRCEEGETLAIALRREVKEEIGVGDLKIMDFIGEIPGAKEGDAVPVFFCATDQSPRLMEPEKFSEWRWIPLKEYINGDDWRTMNPAAHALIKGFLMK